MTSVDESQLRPRPGETREDYCRRLDGNGYEEMHIRKALREHFSMELREFGAFFDNFPEARLRHLARLHEMAPARADFAFARKVAGNLGISQEKAEYWVARFRARHPQE